MREEQEQNIVKTPYEMALERLETEKRIRESEQRILEQMEDDHNTKFRLLMRKVGRVQ